jgi:hypothetical protein
MEFGAGGNMNTARNVLAGAGTQTATVAFGGFTPATPSSATELYNGTAWTSNPTGLNTARDGVSSLGTQTAAVNAVGGYVSGALSATEKWNGTTWTSNPTGLNTARNGMSAAGTQTAALIFSGVYTPAFANYKLQNLLMDQLGLNSFIKYSKRNYRWIWNSNSSFMFWWKYYCSICSYRIMEWNKLDNSK